MPRMTRRTITTLPSMEQELKKVREQGYAVDDREIMDSLRCIAAPIMDRNGHVRYAISCSGLAESLNGGSFEQVLKHLLEMAKNISSSLGYQK
jgi:DNA-binding IclR family transcriptional regulator